MDDVDVDTVFDMPGGDNFRNVTGVFNNAARDMDPGSVVFTEGFSLQDAMSVLEIGEPRLDSGITLQEELQPPFNSLLQMLPEEICWILDRSFACEMEWHAGNMLSQTVFTLLYVHHLTDFNPDFIPLGALQRDASRPPELITVVLRAAVFGLLKSCDLTWRELSQGNVHDGEDWQSEKCEVSLLEGVQVKHVLSNLDEACAWLWSSSKVTMPWRDALLARLLLRKAILELMDCGIYRDPARFHAHLTFAREQLRSIRSRSCPVPALGSHASLAFDPFIARRLSSFGPLRTHELPPQERVWDALEGFLEDWDDLRLLCGATSISTWEVLGYLRAWSTQPRQKFPYMRSSTQSAFFDGVLVLNKFPLTWVIDHFFSETLDLSYDTFVRAVKERWRGSSAPPFAELESLIRKVILGHIKGLYQNPPRRRRLFMKSLVDWHALYDLLLNITSQLNPLTDGARDPILLVPDAALLWRLSVVREVVLSGFQLELYTMEEKAFAYWYVAQIVEEHLSRLDSCIPAVSKESTTYSEMKFQYEFLTALQIMSMAMFSVTTRTVSFSLQRLRLNFVRRYKWAFRSSYDVIDSAVVAPPDFFKFLSARQVMFDDEGFSPSDSFKLARYLLGRLTTSPTGWAGHWSEDRIQFVQNLAAACEKLCALPASVQDLHEYDLSTLRWDPRMDPWFPSIWSSKSDDADNST